MFGITTRVTRVHNITAFSRRSNSTIANISQSPKRAFVFRSTSTNPFINLSIEHYIFQSAPAGSRVLFFYVNDPCVVIGRNQNPWLEVNLRALSQGIGGDDSTSIDFVRRRSGGGTVWHDAGNVNWSVICDLNEFTRDKHAEMVTRGLRRLGIQRAKVNERHDIVLDQGSAPAQVDEKDLHVTPFKDAGKPALKVSGSAYKIAKNRALHHGTALLGSENLGRIGQILKAPGRQFITAKGVESVRSPVANLGVSREDFERNVEDEFSTMYRVNREDAKIIDAGEECLEIEAVRKGVEELRSEEWRYLQTPQFNFSWPLDPSKESSGRIDMSVKHGVIEEIRWSGPGATYSIRDAQGLVDTLQGQKLHQLAHILANTEHDLHGRIGSRLSELFPSSHGPVRQ